MRVVYEETVDSPALQVRERRLTVTDDMLASYTDEEIVGMISGGFTVVTEARVDRAPVPDAGLFMHGTAAVVIVRGVPK